MQTDEEMKFDFTKKHPTPEKQGWLKTFFKLGIRTEIKKEIQFAKRFHEVVLVYPYQKLTAHDKKYIRDDFEKVVQKFGLTDDDLAKKRTYFTSMKLLFSFIALSFVYSFGYFSYTHHTATAFTFLVWSTVWGMLALQYGLRAYQIKTRNLCSAKQYFKVVLNYFLGKGE